MKFLIFLALAAVLVAPSIVLASNGRKGGPSFTDYEWTEIVATDFSTSERWEPRAGLQAVELDNHLFVIAGRTPSPTFDNPFASIIHGDVWVSPDLGKTWVELLEHAEAAGLWRNRAYFEAVTKGGYMYIMGGQNFTRFIPDPPFVLPSEFFKDVWRSVDGLVWEQVTDNAEWAKPPKATIPPEPPCGPPVTQGRAGLSAVSYRGKLWVLGGSQGDDLAIGGGPNCRQVFNDAWYSEDGSDWHLATDNAPWEARAGGVALVKGGWLCLMGGEKGFTGEQD